MLNKVLYLFTLIVLFSVSLLTAQNEVHVTEDAHQENAQGERDIKAEIKAEIKHHLKDTHDFHIWTIDKEKDIHVSMPLPVILWDNGLHVFMSSKFHHGKSVAESKGNYYKLYHNKIYKTDSAGTITYDEEHHPTNTKPFDFSITKGVAMIFITAILMFLLFSKLGKSYAKNNGVATGLGRFFEPIILYVRDDIAKPNIGKNYKQFMPFLLTTFFFIWFLNIFGLTPFGINVTGNIAITFALALMTFIITHVSAKKDYWKHIFWMPGVPVPMKIILAPIELLGTIIKPFALMIRLYANMSAGHIVMMSLIGLMFVFHNWVGSSLSFVLAFAISIIEILVAALQAYIFTMLSALYFGAAVQEHDDH